MYCSNTVSSVVSYSFTQIVFLSITESKVPILVYYSDACILTVDICAVSNAPTPCNLMQHIYFNLSGSETLSIEDHECEFNSTYYMPSNKEHMVTGDCVNVSGSVYDFLTRKNLGEFHVIQLFLI